MADPVPPPAPEAAGTAAAAAAAAAPKLAVPAAATPTTTATASAAESSTAAYKAPQPGALRQMGIPGLPKKLPSRNWMIFWTVLGSFSAAVIYDKREKKRATMKWARTVSHLAKEPMANPQQMPRKLTVFLEAPPSDGLLPSQEHYIEYIKPILAASGLDWEFVQGRKEGDIRAAVAERIRRARDTDGSQTRVEGQEQTKDEIIKAMRERAGIPEHEGIKGDIVVGRHTWKEYMRGLHEGWLGPLTAPVTAAQVEPAPNTDFTATDDSSSSTSKLSVPEVVNVDDVKPEPETEDSSKKTEEPKKDDEDEEESQISKRPPQPKPYNTPEDYSSAILPMLIPNEFPPSAPIQCPHSIGFLKTPGRLWRFLNRRKLADDVGRQVAAVCLAHAREYYPEDPAYPDLRQPEYKTALLHEEARWQSKIWKEDNEKGQSPVYNGADSCKGQEKIWNKDIVTDSRITARMRRFDLLPEDEERSRQVVVPETEIEGWIKGSLRELWTWCWSDPVPNPRYAVDGEFS